MCKISGDGNDLQDSQHQSRRNKRSAINTLVIITLCYAMCFIPLSAINMNHGYKLLNVREDFLEILERINTVEYIILTLLALSNSGINSFIFLIRSKEITTYYKSLVRKLFFKSWMFVYLSLSVMKLLKEMNIKYVIYIQKYTINLEVCE